MRVFLSHNRADKSGARARPSGAWEIAFDAGYVVENGVRRRNRKFITVQAVFVIRDERRTQRVVLGFELCAICVPTQLTTSLTQDYPPR